MRNIKNLSVAILALSLLFAGCKPDVKTESKNYQKNIETIVKLKSEYSAFNTQLSRIETNARTRWAKTTAITDLEAKAEAMEKVNDGIELKLFTQLRSLEARNDGIDSSIKSIRQKKFPQGKMDRVRSNLADVRKKQRESRQVLANADTSTMETATDAADKAVALLIDADGILSQTKSLAKEKKKRKKRK